jgi:hypothetical protein
MKKIIYFTLLLFYFHLFDSKIHAQTKALIIKDNNENSFIFDLEKNTKLEFKANNVVVSENGKGTIIPFASIRSLKFENTAYASIESIKEENFIQAKIFPNPVKDLCQIEFESHNPQSVILKIYTLQGQLVQQETITAIKGQNTLFLCTNELNSGYYLCQLQLGTKVQILNFIKN